MFLPAWALETDLQRLVLQPFVEDTKEDATAIPVATRAVGLNVADVFTLLGYYTAANLVRTKTNQAFVPGSRVGVCRSGVGGWRRLL
jgi:hypothetical protein